MKKINVITGHNIIYNKDLLAVDIIRQYQQYNCVEIHMNNEGPNAEAIGLYTLLDYITEQFEIDKSKIKIITHNAEEAHPEYVIDLKPQHWIRFSILGSKKYNLSDKSCYLNKDVTTNLFGCLFNIPSWNRLCILSHIHRLQNKSLLACNVSFSKCDHNMVTLDNLVNEAPSELYNVVDYLKTNPTPLIGHPGHKPDIYENMEILKFYNSFFVDVVAETYTTGQTFFITEKTLRPIIGLTPFIIYGPQGYLSNLKARYGFKTFSEFWDEQYDDYQGYERITQMYKVFESLDSLTDSERIEMYNSMQNILNFNYNRLFDLHNAH